MARRHGFSGEQAMEYLRPIVRKPNTGNSGHCARAGTQIVLEGAIVALSFSDRKQCAYLQLDDGLANRPLRDIQFVRRAGEATEPGGCIK